MSTGICLRLGLRATVGATDNVAGAPASINHLNGGGTWYWFSEREVFLYVSEIFVL